MEGPPSGVALSVSFGQRFGPGHELAGADQRKPAQSAGADQFGCRSVLIEQHLEWNRLILYECLCIAATTGPYRRDVGPGSEDLLISLTDLTGPFAAGESAEMTEEEDDPGVCGPAVTNPLLGPLGVDQVHCAKGGDVK